MPLTADQAQLRLLQALQENIQQLEVRASVAESGKNAAEQCVTDLQRQLAAVRRAHTKEMLQMLHQLEERDKATVTIQIGPLESQASPRTHGRNGHCD